MDFFIGILLIIFVAPMVGIIGRWIENAGREGLAKHSLSVDTCWCSESPDG